MSTKHAAASRPRRRNRLVTALRWLLMISVGGWLLAALYLVSLHWFFPPLTAVQFERRLQATLGRKPYQQRRVYLPIDRISLDLQRAVVAAEDARFYQHHGFDWREIRNAMEEDPDRPARGASTITQQLVKNLFFGTGRSYLRKGIEATLVPVAEYSLGKRRILELYLNVAEWGPGIFGAEAAARYHYSIGASKVNRDQAQRLAAILPSPLRRRPDRMSKYSAIIDGRMRQMGW